jgi:hypothetical protein
MWQRLKERRFPLMVVSYEELLVRVIVGIAIAVCGYKPYQIEMEYRQNIVACLNAQTPVDCITGVNLLAH